MFICDNFTGEGQTVGSRLSAGLLGGSNRNAKVMESQKDEGRIMKGGRRWLLQLPRPQQPLYFVVVGQREDVQTFGPMLKQIPEFDGGATFKRLGAELADAQPGMLMRAAKRFP